MGLDIIARVTENELLQAANHHNCEDEALGKRSEGDRRDDEGKRMSEDDGGEVHSDVLAISMMRWQWHPR